MLHTNYQNLLNSLSLKTKGLWRLEAIAKLTKKIQKGETKWTYLRNLIKRSENNENVSFLQIISSKSMSRIQIDPLSRLRSRSSQTFFVTQIKPNYYFNLKKNFNDQIFMNLDEELMYSPIELHPFEIKYTRRRDPNQRLYNIQELQKEIEYNYDKIKREQRTIRRPYTSFCGNNKIKKKFKNNENNNIGKYVNRVNAVSAKYKKMSDIREKLLPKNEKASNTVIHRNPIQSASANNAKNKIIKDELNQLLKEIQNEKNNSFQTTIKNTNFYNNKQNNIYGKGKNFSKMFNELRNKNRSMKFNKVDYIGKQRNNNFKNKKIIGNPNYFDKISTSENTANKSNLKKINSFLTNKNKE